MLDGVEGVDATREDLARENAGGEGRGGGGGGGWGGDAFLIGGVQGRGTNEVPGGSRGWVGISVDFLFKMLIEGC